MKKEKYTPVSTSDLLPGSLRPPDSKTVPEVERVRRYPDRSEREDLETFDEMMSEAAKLSTKQVIDGGRNLAHLLMLDSRPTQAAMVTELVARVVWLTESDDEGGASPGNDKAMRSPDKSPNNKEK